MAEHRHKRDTNARRKPRAALVAGALALLATTSAVTIGVFANNPDTRDLVAQDTVAQATAPDPSGVATQNVERAEEPVSRSSSRLDQERQERLAEQRERLAAQRERAATLRAVRAADTRLWTTTVLNLWSTPDEDAVQYGVIETGEHVLVTGRKTAERTEIVVEGQSRWVTAGYLSEEEPVTAPAGLSMEPCPDPSVESGLTSDAVYVYRSVCNAFPQITTYGGWDAHGEHASGRAIDIMTSDVELGNAIAEFLQEHAAELNLYDIIWQQQIWTPERASEGWRYMESRGSATADHYDHVHVATNG